MWWDSGIYPNRAHPVARESDFEILGVMEATLYISSDACVESAIHGLGHWKRDYPAEVCAVVDRLCSASATLSPGLTTYARAAREGMIQ